jgi:hypothetical protein
MKRVFAALAALLIVTPFLVAQNQAHKDQSKPLPNIAEKTTGMQANPGFFADYWDAREGTLWLRIESSKLETPFILYESLPSGVGSNDIGLDRGEPGESYVVHFERAGKQVFLVAENQDYRAITDDADQRSAVRAAFPQSVLWGFEVAAEESDAVLIDATKFFLSDVHGVAAAIANAKQGKYKVDPTRSAITCRAQKTFLRTLTSSQRLPLWVKSPGISSSRLRLSRMPSLFASIFPSSRRHQLDFKAARTIHALAISESATWISSRPLTSQS